MKILLLSPVFHGYWEGMVESLQQLGFTATGFAYDDLSAVSQKVRRKLLIELPEQLSWSREEAWKTWVSARVHEVLDEQQPDAVLVIRGDAFTDSLWERLAALPTALWMYDELERTNFSAQSVPAVRAIASYSVSDSSILRERGHNAHHVPLGFNEHCQYQPKFDSAAVFVGARYPNRENLLMDAQSLGVYVRAYGRDWSHAWRDRLRTWQLSRPQVPSGRDLSLTQAYGVMAGSLASFNIHGRQDGFTMRTFEACGVGALQLIDRDDVGDLYEPGVELCVFHSALEAAELIERALYEPQWAKEIQEAGRKRTLAEHTFTHRMKLLTSFL